MPSASHLIFLSPKVAKIRDDEGQKVWLGLQGKPSEAEPEGKRRKGWEPVGRREGREMRLGTGDSEAVTRTGPWAGVRVPPGPLFLVPARPPFLASFLPFVPKRVQCLSCTGHCSGSPSHPVLDVAVVDSRAGPCGKDSREA